MVEVVEVVAMVGDTEHILPKGKLEYQFHESVVSTMLGAMNNCLILYHSTGNIS